MTDTSVDERKAALRATARSRRDALPTEERKLAAETIAAQKFPLAIAQELIASGFMPLKSEINPLPLLQKLTEAGARLALPTIAGRGKPLIMRAWEFGAPLDSGQWGIREPKPTRRRSSPTFSWCRCWRSTGPVADRLRRRLLRYDYSRLRALNRNRRRHCLRDPGGSRQNSDDRARRTARFRANRARSDRFAVS